VAFGPEVIQIFAPAEYYDAIWIIPPVSASVYFMFLYPIFGNIEFYFEENKFVMMASIAGAVVNVILNYICIPIFGYVAAGYTTLACYILFSGGHYIFMKKVLKKHNIDAEVYDIKFIFLFSVIVLIAMFGMIFVYKNMILRYVLIIIMILVVIWKRNTVISIIKSIRKK
jgi:O-antigen/teichoic acid export membrane protein